MNNLLIDYQSDILLLFKNHYRKLITKSTDVVFEEILNLTLKDLNIILSKKEDIIFLEKWFSLVHHQTYFDLFLKKEFTEIIFHSCEKVQVIGLTSKTTFDSLLYCSL